MSQAKGIKIYSRDNVAVALTPLEKGNVAEIDNSEIVLLENIPDAHKFALTDIPAGDPVIKYGNTIGITITDIKKGSWVHDHNMSTCANTRKSYEYTYNQEAVLPGGSAETFMGYSRYDGSVGIRNHLAVIPTVFCANGPLQKIASIAKEKYKKTENFDGILPLTHPYGCSQTGKDLETTGRTIAGIIKNPNFGGVLVVSLGCEINDLVQLKKYMGNFDPSRIKFLVLQESEDELADGMALCDEIREAMNEDKRTPAPLSKLHIALNCGGSDGFSGITANKITGSLAERLVSAGATVSMTEVPEMFGAEHILMNRAINQEVFCQVVSLIENYADYFQRYGEKVSDNPTQGNKAGGLSTIEEKSLGCIQKGGNCAVTEVVAYGGRASKQGLVLVSGPGNDLTGVTGQIAAGAVLTIFTTGRGTPCGFAGPTFRLASNSVLAEKKKGWIDFDAGRLLRVQSPQEEQELQDELYQKVLEVINGNYLTKNEINEYYQMGILRDGVTL
ncbi:UxaA family hydrolase [Sinanaerobacter chloroacetimidivorans]|uniref:Altronate dehydratase n=1 Tax=Sinanaerobacter chloroacetimidivorans TaxID=2818044 RepID=A0A8J7VZ92_9FIRM|nr:altronate dehydratase family protein [Sinanaerobacter chloroacetimidivorans]MBR0597839.1 altronate dehydratase [Sinanaerobacter chloroacetimidivorans]